MMLSVKMFFVLVLAYLFCICCASSQRQQQQQHHSNLPRLRDRKSIGQAFARLSKDKQFSFKTMVATIMALNRNQQRWSVCKSTSVEVCTKTSHDETDKRLMEKLEENLSSRQKEVHQPRKCYRPSKQTKSITRQCECCDLKSIKILKMFMPTVCPCLCKAKTKPTANEDGDNNKNSVTTKQRNALSIFVEPSRPNVEQNEMNEKELAILEELDIGWITGVTVKLVACANKSDVTSINTINMCKTCQYSIQLPNNYSPQFHTHFTCGEGSDVTCLSGQGICAKNVRETPVSILDLSTGVIVERFSLLFTVCCSCELIQGSFLAELV